MTGARRTTRVLVLEEDADIRDVLRELLAGEGYEVVVARDAMDAVAHLRASRKPVVVLCGNADATHLHLLAFFARLATQVPAATRHHYICLTSAPYHIPMPLRAVFGRLAVQVLTKPFDVDILLLAVAHAAAFPDRVRAGQRGERTA